jgi:hypothetical protein
MTTWLPAGPPALGLTVGADADLAGGWLVRPFRTAAGLDGPAGILQGGLATAVPTVAAALADGLGAPLTSVTSRLHAPTPLDAELTLALRPGDGAGHHEVELRDGDRLLVSATVELAGRDPAPDVPDLTELGVGPVPPLVVHGEYPRCFVCGHDNTHPHALRCAFGHVGDEAVVLPWLLDGELAEPGPTIDPLLVAAVLDCPGVWAATPALTAAGYAGCLLAGMEVRWYGEAPAYEVLRIAARSDGMDGRKLRVRTALLDEDGHVYAVASALHIAVTEVPSLA